MAGSLAARHTEISQTAISKMMAFEIVAHRGITTEWPENTLPAFRRAIELGADAIELDVRLTADRVPVVYHYGYLDANSSGTGAIFDHTWADLQAVRVRGQAKTTAPIPTLSEVLEDLGGRIGLEIEIKGPEPEAPALIAKILQPFKSLWESIEITSYEPALLLAMQAECPGLTTDLLFPRSEDWMKLDMVAYQALHRARLAGARAVHLHPTQLSRAVVATIQQQGIAIHAWDVDDEQSLNTVLDLGIPRICTNQFEQAFNFRSRAAKP
jgi:glycerophosphoryl diester phosphodiesterase